MIALAAIVLAAMPAAPPRFPTRAGQCEWVRGRFAFWNGAGIRRITVSGTRHIINLRDDDEDVPDIRFSMRNAWPKEDYWGDFFVCAREIYVAGHMQHVRLRRVRSVIARPI
ncbi:MULTISPECIES: hypothetical protein [Sphingomonas]|uniref:hypothetical protein n=1 Tax=Sphingomonas TaxID=13687 RepID=UPI001269B2B1|nr:MULTISPECIES: hypothetical protein [Sphingomonas]